VRAKRRATTNNLRRKKRTGSINEVIKRGYFRLENFRRRRKGRNAEKEGSGVSKGVQHAGEKQKKKGISPLRERATEKLTSSFVGQNTNDH